MRTRSKIHRVGISLLEMLMVVTILGILAAVVIPRILLSTTTAEANVNLQNISEINTAVERWFIDTGSWPANDLSDIGTHSDYFPDGLPTNPVDGSSYSLNASSHRVN